MGSLTIVMYHYVREIKNSAYSLIKGLEFEGFKRQLDYLESKHTIITAEQLIAFANGTGKIPNDSCLLTFDDGYKDHVAYVLPELLRRKLQGSFFPPVKPVTEREMLDVNCVHFILACQPDTTTLIDEIKAACFASGVSHDRFMLYWQTYRMAGRYDSKDIAFVKRMLQHVLPLALRNSITAHLFKKYVGRNSRDFANELYLSLDDTKKLVESGMYVGGHGYRHLWLNEEPKESQEREINLSLEFLAHIGAPTEDWIMCYPYGGYNSDTLDILKNKKCCIGLTTKVGAAALDRDKLLELSRFNTNDFIQ
jgi:peptidoglycan/xylan/chitin deacetylase (PgdA/CDA1 family)